MQQDKNGNPVGPVSNGILETVQEELKMDHHYVPANKLILVRIDSKTLDNSVLNDWWGKWYEFLNYPMDILLPN